MHCSDHLCCCSVMSDLRLVMIFIPLSSSLSWISYTTYSYSHMCGYRCICWDLSYYQMLVCVMPFYQIFCASPRCESSVWSLHALNWPTVAKFFRENPMLNGTYSKVTQAWVIWGWMIQGLVFISGYIVHMSIHRHSCLQDTHKYHITIIDVYVCRMYYTFTHASSFATVNIST